MKRQITVLILLASAFFGKAQEMKQNKSVLGLHFGNSLVASVYFSEDNWTPEVQKSVVTQVTYDYLVSKGFSVGATVAQQNIQLSLVDTLSNQSIEKGSVSRIYVGGRALWHYGKNPRWDIYSGVKFGIKIFAPYDVVKSHPRSSIIEDKHTRSAPSLGVIPIGCRYLISDNFSIGAQLSVGAPTMSTINFNYAF